jgi:hypothetical protein
LEHFFSQRYYPKEISDGRTNELVKILMKELALESWPKTLQRFTTIHKIGINFKELDSLR